MASKKVNPQALAQLAKQKTTSAAQLRMAEEASKKPRVPSAPSPATTVPPAPPVDWETELFGTTTTTTTVPPSSTTTTTIPGTVKPPRGAPSTDPLSVRLNKNIAEIEGKLFATTPKETVAKVKTGEVKGQPFWKKALGTVFGNPIAEATVLRPLKTIAFVGRIGASTFEESAQWARENLPGGKGMERYEATDYIPVHKQTGKPIAGVGDPIVRNWEEIINTPVSEEYKTKIESSKTEKERNRLLNEATYDVVKGNARTASGSITEWARQIGSPAEFKDYGFGDIAEVQIGRQLVEAGKVSPGVGKWIDRGVGFTGDVVLDPTTYLSMGTTLPAKVAAKGGLKGAGALNLDALVAKTASKVGTTPIKTLTKEVAEEVAVQVGEKAGTRGVQTTSRAIVAEAAKLAEQDLAIKGATAAQKKAAAQAVKESARRWSAIAPRREVGAAARESTANVVRELRDEALEVLKEVAPVAGDTAQVRAAQIFVDTITDDVIRDIAVRGNAAIRGNVARVLSTPGGLRWGIGKYKVAIPGTEKLTAGIGKGFTLPRKALAATQLGRKAIGATTRIGEGGLFGSEYIWNWRTGLRSGYNAKTGQKLTGKEAVDALSRLSEDQAYRALKKTASQTIKVAVDSVFREEDFRPYFNTVHTLLENPSINWTDTAQQIAAATGRDIDEVNLALRIVDIKNEFEDILSELSTELGGPAYNFPDTWFPQALNDKTASWLSRNNPLARKVLGELGFDGSPLPGQSIAPDTLIENSMFFGQRLTAADIAEGVTAFNRIANQNGFKGQFFDTNASSVVQKWAKKFSDDYAFLRRLAQTEWGVMSARPSVMTGRTIKELANDEVMEIANAIDEGMFDDLISVGSITDIKRRQLVSKLAKQLDLDEDTINAMLVNMKDQLQSGFYDVSAGPAHPVFGESVVVGVVDPDKFRSLFDFNVMKERLKSWTPEQMREIKASIGSRQVELARTPRTEINKTAIEDAEYALSQISRLVDSIETNYIIPGFSPREFVVGRSGFSFEGSLDELVDGTMDELQSLQAFIANKPENIAAMIDNINPKQLTSVVNLIEDAFIKLDNALVPDLYAQREIAYLYSNVKRMKEPRFQQGLVRWMRDFNRFIKTWVTSTPGFHSRNIISNTWQLVAAGAELRNLNEGLKILKEWNGFVKNQVRDIGNAEDYLDAVSKLADDATETDFVVRRLADRFGKRADDVLMDSLIVKDILTRRGVPAGGDWRFVSDLMDQMKGMTRATTVVEDPELMIDRFLSEGPGKDFPEPVQRTFRDTMVWTGAAGFGDIEEVFGAAIPSRLGVTGQEVPVRTSKIGKVASRMSETLGFVPRKSREYGGIIENYSRFLLTYDGVRQGLTPEQAAGRTARYLVDYEDMTQIDEYAKLIFPFWMWMSRNLPLQTANMFMNPKAYAIYQDFRQNFEDENGDNALLPSYLKDAGAFKAPFGENIYIKPDLGFPGAGSPSPLQSGVTDVRSLLSAIPLVNIGAAAAGEELFTGRPIEGFGERALEVTGQALPPLSTAGRYISGGLAGRDLPGPSWVQELLGVPAPRESGPQAQTIRALSSLLGLPITTVGPDQQNIARYEQLDRLKAYEEWIRNQGRR